MIHEKFHEHAFVNFNFGKFKEGIPHRRRGSNHSLLPRYRSNRPLFH